ncbi:MAG: hypothetical protein LBG90_03710 [Spirochaetaceae bacterium]|jgi:hypothetical protein|nr:hypothetical protein [Spirochaetaceae bacterium]
MKKRLLLSIGLVLALGIGGFFARSPAVVVTDSAFDVLYGPDRTRRKVGAASLKLFRRVRPVPVADNADPDMVAFAVEEAEADPYCIIFPYRYNEGAEAYAERHPSARVFVLGDRHTGDRTEGAEGAVFVETDWKTDLYRAGLCAGSLALSGEDGEVLFFQTPILSDEGQELFERGLRDRGVEKPPKYLSVSQEYSDNKNVACAVVGGRAEAFFEQNLGAPVVLFSWVDPALTGDSVKVLFDDSPWALVSRVVQLIPGKERMQSIPSDVVVLGRRILERGLVGDLKKTRENNI